MKTASDVLSALDQSRKLTDDGIPRALTDKGARALRSADKLLKVADGGGLFLAITPAGGKIWRYKYRLNGREGLYTLGAFPSVGLSLARSMHRAARWIVAQGRHPLDWIEAEQQRIALEESKAAGNTLGGVLDRWLAVADQTARPSTAKHRRAQLARGLNQEIRARPIAEITRRELMAELQQLDIERPVTAKQIRMYLQQAFDFAIDHELVGANPVPPSTALRIGRARRVVPRKAMPLSAMGRFLRELRDTPKTDRTTKAAMRLLILTWCRTNEVLQARWSEFDLERATWLIPAERMKAGTAHEIPLSRQAAELLRGMRELRGASEFVFPNRRSDGRGMCRTVLTEWLRRHGFKNMADAHGFRATASTWANETGRHLPDVIERALAHGERNKTRAAYNRSTYSGFHRELLQEWADLLDAFEAEGDACKAE
ncbi:tyrosine-type recombinase/integrase [Niveibacterium sp. 24ML]|uniref:tyrosine-type recombinase/integrase n=1 Tax=Niveibacterium sp. 24ML TaxID=2985512 RepID=UPI002271F48B|nr:tyrosine-type recombinase/integrase [Niveibacterium sp. 24ML]MCX9157930.1 tyrosine-type recombinase/integrase [Niveibacterium sp. 24ML]